MSFFEIKMTQHARKLQFQATNLLGKRRDKAQQTRVKLRNEVRRLAAYMAVRCRLNNIADMKTKHVESFFSDMIAAGASKTTLEGYRYASKVLAQMIGKPSLVEGLYKGELGSQIRRSTEDRFRPINANLEKISEVQARLYEKGAWQGLAYELQRAFGLRLKESFRSFPMIEKQGKLYLDVRDGKGGRTRLVAVESREQLELLARVNEYVQANNLLSLIPADKSFPQAYDRQRNHIRSLGGTKLNHAHSHASRHEYAQRRIDEGVDWRDVAEELGHGRLSVLSFYACFEE